MCFACALYSLVLILHIPAYLGIKGDWFFQTNGVFFGRRFMYKLVYYNLYHVSNFMRNLIWQICMKQICIGTELRWMRYVLPNLSCLCQPRGIMRNRTNWYNTICLIQIVLYQYVMKLIQICYIQFFLHSILRKIGHVKSDTWYKL